MTLRRVAIPSPNYSSRAGARVRLIVLHTAQGALTFQSLGAYFADPAAEVSSHVGIDDTPDTVGEYVQRAGKAWTQADANPVCVAAELCGFAEWDIATWQSHPAMLANCAAWIAEEAAALGVPLVKLSPAQAQAGAAGVVQHADLGGWGGGHWDCGPNFPIDQVLAAAAGGGGDDDVTEQDKQDIINGVLAGMRQLYAPPSGELYNRGKQYTNDSIGQNGGKFTGWAKDGAGQALDARD